MRDDKQKLAAYKLFMQGLRGTAIAEKMKEMFENPPSQPTIYRWAKEGGWKGKKGELVVQAEQEIMEQEGSEYIQQILDDLDRYEKLVKKSEDELQNLPFRKAKDAASALHMGIQGAHKLRVTAMSARFVYEVLATVRDEVNDEKTLQRIGAKLQRLHQEYAQRNSSV